MAKKSKDPRKKPAIHGLGKRVERYDLLDRLAQAPVGVAFGKIGRGDIENARQDLQNIF